MKKYLVIANTYQGGYGCEYTLFGVFDTKEDAVKWIIDHPVVTIHEADGIYNEEKFYFFSGFEEGVGRYYIGRNGEKIVYGTPRTKEEHASLYVDEFDGHPMCIGGYRE